MPTHKNIKLNPVKLSIITVSSSRYAQKQKGNSVVDDSGQIAIDSLLKDGHEVISSKIVADDSTLIKSESLKSIIEDRVDGLILIVVSGVIQDAVFIEVKSGKNLIKSEQIMKYYKLARSLNNDAFINEIS